MKKSYKKVLSLVLVLLMTLTLVGGCASKKADPKEGDKKNDTTETIVEKEAGDAEGVLPAVDTTKVEEFTILISGSLANSFNWDNPVAEEITRRTGVKLVPEIVVDDPDQRIALMLASGQYTDIVLNVNSALNQMIDSGDAVQLDELIDNYGPNIKAFYGDMYDRIRHTDGNIYSFGFGASTQGEYSPGTWWNVGFFVQNQALINQNYPSILTPEDFENVIRTELAQNPRTADGQQRYGLCLGTSDNFRFIFSILQPANLVNGLPVDGDFVYKEDTDKVELAMRQDYMREYIRWYNKMYNEGLIDPESFTQNYDTYVSKISAGRVIGLINGGWEFNGAIQALRDAGQGNNAYMAFDPVINPNTMKWSDLAGGIVANSGGFFITSKCKNPAKIVNFFDFLASEEGQILTEWGIEDVNYTIDANGYRVQTQADKDAQAADPMGYSQTTGVQLYARDYGQWLHQPYGVKTSNGQMLFNVDTSNADASFSQEEKDVLAKYGYKYFTEVYPSSMDLPARIYGDLGSLNTGTDEDVTVARQQFDDSKLPNLARAIMCAPDKFDATWDAYMKELDDINIDVYVQKANEALQARWKSWGVK